VAFLSFASNLVPGDTNGEGDVFVHDTPGIVTTRMSVAAGGEQGNDFSCNPAISHDGRVIGFFSDSTNLVPGGPIVGQRGTRQIFVRDSWRIAGIGDLDGNGKDDIVWRNTTTGTVAAWLMNGLAVSSSGVIGGVPTNWIIAGIGDLDDDGNDDIVWRNTITGDVAGWLMDGLDLDSFGVIVSAVPTEWIIPGIGDLDGNGKDDIVWHNMTTGTTAGWLMDGLDLDSFGIITASTP
jgi:hypothetical protein